LKRVTAPLKAAASGSSKPELRAGQSRPDGLILVSRCIRVPEAGREVDL